MVSNEEFALVYELIAAKLEASKKQKDAQAAQGTTHVSTPQIKVQQASPTMASAMLPAFSKCHYNLSHVCPLRVTMCHWHHATGKECYLSWHHCPIAIKAIEAAFYAHGAWIGAPLHWNKCHAQCVQEGAKVSDMCYLHQEIHKEQELSTLS